MSTELERALLHVLTDRVQGASNSADYTTVVASASRTATFNSDDQTNSPIEKGIRLFLNISAVTGTSPTLDIKVQIKDPLSGSYHDMAGAAFAQKTGTGTDEIIVYPGVAETANVSVSDYLGGATWRVVNTLGGTSPDFTYTIAAQKLI